MPLDSTPWWKYIERDLDDIPDAPTYPGLKPGTADDFANLRKFIELNKQTNTPRSKQARRNFGPMPARGSKRGRMAPSRRSTKRKAPRGKKRTIKRKAPIRKSSKRKKRKVSAKSKSVSLTVGTARSRIVDHASPQHTHAAYQAFSSIGSRDQFMKPIAQSMLLHYMHRVGDYRLNSSVVPERYFEAATVANPQIATWSQMKINFVYPGYATDYYPTEVTIDAQSGDLSRSLDDMTDSLATALLARAKDGHRISQVTMFRSNNCIVCDTNAGRNVIELSSSAIMKIQNVTLADSTATGDDSGDRCSVLNIHRNPLNGLAYSFKNAQPKFKHGYMLSKVQAEQDVIVPLSLPYETRYPGVGETATMGSAGGAEWKIPPTNPSIMFSNFSGKTSVAIQPGGHKSFSLREYYSGPINSCLDRYFPVTPSQVDAMVPGGSCMLIGLKPQYRTSTSEKIQLETEHTYTYAARMTRGKMSIMPMPVTLA